MIIFVQFTEKKKLSGKKKKSKTENPRKKRPKLIRLLERAEIADFFLAVFPVRGLFKIHLRSVPNGYLLKIKIGI